HGEAIDVEHRQGCEETLLLIAQSRDPGITHDNHGSHVAVAEHRAFGLTRSTGGVQNQRSVFTRDYGVFNVLAGTANCVWAQGGPGHGVRSIAGESIALGRNRWNWNAQQKLHTPWHGFRHVDGDDGL